MWGLNRGGRLNNFSGFHRKVFADTAVVDGLWLDTLLCSLQFGLPLKVSLDINGVCTIERAAGMNLENLAFRPKSGHDTHEYSLAWVH